jgi:hypothetical protein
LDIALQPVACTAGHLIKLIVFLRSMVNLNCSRFHTFTFQEQIDWFVSVTTAWCDQLPGHPYLTETPYLSLRAEQQGRGRSLPMQHEPSDVASDFHAAIDPRNNSGELATLRAPQ